MTPDQYEDAEETSIGTSSDADAPPQSFEIFKNNQSWLTAIAEVREPHHTTWQQNAANKHPDLKINVSA